MAASCCGVVVAAAGGAGALCKIDGITRKEDYVKITGKATSQGISQEGKAWCKGVWRSDNDPKQTTNMITKWLQGSKVNVLERPSQRPDLNLMGKPRFCALYLALRAQIAW